jgi:hypothetical protein
MLPRSTVVRANDYRGRPRGGDRSAPSAVRSAASRRPELLSGEPARARGWFGCSPYLRLQEAALNKSYGSHRPVWRQTRRRSRHARGTSKHAAYATATQACLSPHGAQVAELA